MSDNIFDCCIETPKDPLEVFHTYTDLPNYVNGENLENLEIAIEQVDVITRKVKTNWHYLQSVILNEITIASDDLIKLREEINKCLRLIIECLKCCESDILKERYLTSSWVNIKKIAQLTLPISELEQDIYLKLTSPRNKNKCPVYQYFHTFLDLQFHLLIFDHISGNNEELQSRINIVVIDLITLSVSAHKQKTNSAFVCNCTQKFWLIVQLLCEKHLEGSFWMIFNKNVENLNGDCILWLLKDVAKNLKQPNYTPLESALKKVLSGGEFTTILPVLKSLEPLLCDLWLKSSKIEIYQTLWDYFSKRLNVSSRVNIDFTLTQLIDLIDTILWSRKDCDYDFELFLAMLTTHLIEHPYHWGKMKGRIYSQLGPNKLKDLQNNGIFNVLLLYLALTKVNFEELSKKFLSFIENLPQEKKQTQLIWSFYAAFVVRHVRENRDIETIIQPFIKMSEEASTDQKFFHLIKTFVSDFDTIITTSTNLELHQWLLINSWIHQYMTTCYYPDLLTLLNLLLRVIERISNELLWGEWESSFKNNVYPTLKYVAGSRTAPETCGTLAAKIVTLSPSLHAEAFTFFNAENIAPKVSASFLCVILENYPNFFLSPAQEIVALQSWVKFCLLTRDGYEQLTKNIIKLDVIPPFIKTALKDKDPLCAFIEYVGGNKEYSQSVTMHKLCENFFGQADRCINQFLSQPDNEGTVLRIYTCIGLAFYKIGPLLYNKHKSSCPYARLVSATVLPTELMMGKPIHTFVLQSVKKTWHLFFEATVKLNTNDAFLDRILRDLVTKYVPHFAIVDSPMLKCLDNDTNAEIILDKLSSVFFKQPSKEPESNIFKSLKLVNDFVQSTTSEKSLKLVVNKTLYGLFEVVMFHNQRNMAINVIKSVTSSVLYPKVKSDFEDTIVSLTEKHLAFNSPNYFQLMGHLARLVPQSVKNTTPRIKQHLSNVERMRGVGYDKNLRLSLEKLEALLHKS
ncbi:protein MMS22-like [Tribolium madens]|uniref:protein MMS22-like n=1 Tax=Tribolium madens TaxID=41895 RepID=UPI001CF74BB6|nr:protein MMS22-like [Tribolium madens]